MLSVHISDIHFGPQFQRRVFETAIEEIKLLGTRGLNDQCDFTENGLLNEYRLAQNYLKKFKAGRFIICSGNHDYGTTDFLLFGDSSPTNS